MKWFSLGLVLVCLFSLQIVIEAKPVDEEGDAAVESASSDGNPAESTDETPTEATEETPVSAESSKEKSPGKVISAPVSTKKPWSIESLHNEAQMILETIRDGIDTADRALEFYDKLVDRVIPWDQFEQTVTELDRFRSNFSDESAALIGSITTLIMDGKDNYHSASRNIYEWTAAVAPRLKIYLRMFDNLTEENIQAQRNILLKVLDDGINKMTEASNHLEQTTRTFNKAGGQLDALTIRLNAEFDEKSEFVQKKILRTKIKGYTGGAIFGIPGVLVARYFLNNQFIPKILEKLKSIEDFYNDLKTQVQTGATQISNIKDKFKEEVQHISELKGQTEEAKININVDDIPEMRDEIIVSAYHLMKHCEEYATRHRSKTAESA